MATVVREGEEADRRTLDELPAEVRDTDWRPPGGGFGDFRMMWTEGGESRSSEDRGGLSLEPWSS